jgi:cephalosporin hydroxylase
MRGEIPGWLTPEVGAAMRNLIWKVKPEVCVEIGVFAGKSLINTALALKENGHGVVYGIDPWRLDVALAGASPDEFDWNKADLDAVHYDCMRAIWEHGVERFAVVIRTQSREAQYLFPIESIEILYIDGGHSEDSSVDDVTWYLPRVKLGCHVWLDDTNYDSLQKAIGIVEQQCQLVKDFGHARLYKKL